MITKKNYCTLFALFSMFTIFSQAVKTFDYEKYSNPNTKNQLSLYFKENVDKKLLKKAQFFTNKKNIILSFYINQQGEPYKLNVSSKGTEEYYTAIKNTFTDYFKKFIGYDSLSSKHQYSLQIISKKGNRKIFNCSSKLIVTKPPIFSECNDLDLYEDLKNCLNLEVKKHFYQEAKFNELKNDSKKEIALIVKFSVNKHGKLVNKNKEAAGFYQTEINRILNSFPFLIEPSSKNNTFYAPNHSFKIDLTKNKDIVVKDLNSEFINFTKPSTSNDFSIYLKQNLTEKDLQKSNLSRISKKLTLSFEIDENNTPFNIKVNAKSIALAKKIETLFKEYPLEKFNFSEKRKFNTYILQVLSYQNQKAIVNTSSVIGYERPPIFPGCEHSASMAEVKSCFSKGIQMHFSKKFDADLPNRIGLLKGRKKVAIAFKISKEGKIFDIDVNAPHAAIIREVVQVMRKIPKIKPGYQNGNAVNIKYRIPFTMIVN
ncbi:hypothetical protein [Polaribacter sp. R77954]|uniref:hypothetical protein n=1 Tax=Polaribacter sp. R77954 TaxID=3093870 RepID=UPI0037CA1E52